MILSDCDPPPVGGLDIFEAPAVGPRKAAVGRIRFITVKIALYKTGYAVSLSVFDDLEVIHRDQFERLSWREACQVAEAVTDTYRPGLELLNGGIQETLF